MYQCHSIGDETKKTSIDFRFISVRRGVSISLEDVRRYFELVVNQGHFAYRSVSFSVNDTCGTVHFSVKY